jgi:hydrogenase maturation protease
LGIGNPGRRDDGLGPRLIEALAGDARVRAEFRYQLGIEDALAVRDADAVVFADASRTVDGPASLTPLAPDGAIAFTTHALAPAAVLALCRELYGRTPPARVLAMRGYDWDVGEGLSEGAERSLVAALAIIKEFLSSIEK